MQTTSREGLVFFALGEGKLVSFSNTTKSEITAQGLTTNFSVRTSMELLD